MTLAGMTPDNGSTEFEIGKRYPMREPGMTGVVTAINEELTVLHSEDGAFWKHGLNGRFLWDQECEHDLLLPAIETVLKPAPDPEEPLRAELREAYGVVRELFDSLRDFPGYTDPKAAEWLARNAGFGPGKEGDV